MSEETTLSRREWMARAGCAVGGAVALGGLQACSSTSNADPAPGADVSDTPYLYSDLDTADVASRAYSNYYVGGCCYGSFSALINHLADTVGAPFDEFPVDFSKFGAGGIAGYGSVCGAILGGAMVFSLVIPGAHRNAMIQDLFRWYEGFNFPEYVPPAGTAVKVEGLETAYTRTTCNSHLCHASVTTWCTQAGVTPASNEKKERCSRLTADVATKVAEMLNDYLATGTFAGVAAMDATSAGCMDCHTSGAEQEWMPKNVASGMKCGTCHDPADVHE